MKRVFVIAFIMPVAFAAVSAFAGIGGSKHDMTGGGHDVSAEERGAVCSYCHVPFGVADSAPAPLWALRQKEEDKTVRYNLYSWETATNANAAERPGASTLNCLACHDGTIGKSISFDYIPAPTDQRPSNSGHYDSAYDRKAGALPEQSAVVRHPVSVAYVSGKAGLTTQENVKENGVVLSGPDANRVECASCHNPHITGLPFALIKPVVDLCSACHTGRASGKHVMASYGFGDDHPVKGMPDPLRAGKDLSCISCHNPHPFNRQLSFVDETSGPAVICLRCHKKISVRTDGP